MTWLHYASLMVVMLVGLVRSMEETRGSSNAALANQGSSLKELMADISGERNKESLDENARLRNEMLSMLEGEQAKQSVSQRDSGETYPRSLRTAASDYSNRRPYWEVYPHKKTELGASLDKKWFPSSYSSKWDTKRAEENSFPVSDPYQDRNSVNSAEDYGSLLKRYMFPDAFSYAKRLEDYSQAPQIQGGLSNKEIDEAKRYGFPTAFSYKRFLPTATDYQKKSSYPSADRWLDDEDGMSNSGYPDQDGNLRSLLTKRMKFLSDGLSWKSTRSGNQHG